MMEGITANQGEIDFFFLGHWQQAGLGFQLGATVAIEHSPTGNFTALLE